MRRHVPACGVPLPVEKTRPSRPGRTEWSSLDFFLGSTALMGFQISRSALRRFAPADGWLTCISAPAGPTCPLSSLARPHPIYSSGSLRRRSPRSVARVNSKGRDLRIEDARFDGLLGFDSRLGSVSATLRAPFDCGPREANVTDRSCLGLLPLSGLPGTFDVHRSRLEPRSIISLREAGALSRRTAWDSSRTPRSCEPRYPLVGFGDPSRDMTPRRAAVEEICAAPPCARPKPAALRRRPFSVLKGLMPCPFRRIRVSAGAAQPV